MAKFNIINKAEELTNYILTIVEKSPKKVRLDIIPELRKKALVIIEYIIKANCCPINGNDANNNNIQNRKDLQNQAIIEINVLNIFLEIANKHNYITNKQLEISTKLSTELYNMIVKWQVSDDKRQNRSSAK